MAQFLKANEYPEEGIAIIEDTQGQYLVTKKSDEIIPLPDINAFAKRQQYMQSPRAMMT